MLHITSIVQTIAKLQNTPSRTNYLNGLNRNYSFIYDNYLDKYEFNYNDIDEQTDELNESSSSKGYWGYLRDIKADRKQRLLNNNNNNTSDQKIITDFNNDPVTSSQLNWFGIYNDTHLSEESNYRLSSLSSSTSVDLKKEYTPNSDDSFTALNISNDFNGEQHKKSSDNLARKLIYDYKRSQFKIEAGKRDEAKIYFQYLQDEEAKLKKEEYTVYVSSNESTHTTTNISPSLVNNHVKSLNFVYFSNSTSSPSENNNDNSSVAAAADDDKKINLNNFKRAFNVISKLNKSMNIFSGQYSHSAHMNALLNSKFFSFSNVHLSVRNDVNIFEPTKFANNNQQSAANLASQSSQNCNSNTINLCSNLTDNTMGAATSANHSTMLFEYNGIKLGFIALYDEEFYQQLKKTTTHGIEYSDFVVEANRLSEQLKMCGANLIVALVYFANESNETRLLTDTSSNLNVIFSYSTRPTSTSPTANIQQSTSPADYQFTHSNHKYMFKFFNFNLDHFYLINFKLDLKHHHHHQITNTNYLNDHLVEIKLVKYFID